MILPGTRKNGTKVLPRGTNARMTRNIKDMMDAPQRRYGGGPEGAVFRKQYLALLEAVGAKGIADQLAKEMIIAPYPTWPEPYHFATWALDWQDNKYDVPAADVRKMRQRLVAREEWLNRQFIGKMRDTGNTLADKFQAKVKAGEDIGEDRVTLKYAADAVGFNTATTSQAYGTPKATAHQINKFSLNVGPPPPKRTVRVLDDPNVIDAEVRELPVGDG
jgi:hypothetical protein